MAKKTKTEAELWADVEAVATGALDFMIAFLGLRAGAGGALVLSAYDRDRLVAIVRAVSAVESRHGTQGKNQPERDPFQCGNPNDSWWKEFTGQTANKDFISRGPGPDGKPMKGLYADKVAAAAEAFTGFPKGALMSLLTKAADGHDDVGFGQPHSYVWGIPYLLHRTNTTAGDKTWQCGDLSRKRLIDGAVAYNGGGVKNYRERIEAALTEMGDPLGPDPAPLHGVETFTSVRAMALGEAIRAAHASGYPVRSVKVEFGTNDAISSVGVEFASRSETAAGITTAPRVFAPGQRYPDLPESDASGPFVARVVRGTPEFDALADVKDPRIVFKDEEGTGADRRMIPLLSDALMQLADKVAAEWKGVKLRVTEAWDEDNEHVPQSLHYEGRAADITTHPVDGAKLGRLAGLAAECSLSWVFFEDSKHVHVSVQNSQ
jgi:hypothetical protein